MAEIALERVEKVFADGTRAVAGVSVVIDDGELFVLVGPSGCGKSVLLRMLAGLEAVSGGEVRIGGRRVNELRPAERDVAMVFESGALYPHLTVSENLAFGLEHHKVPADEVERRVSAAARVLGLEPYLDRKPDELSAAHRHATALGRAIVRRAQAFLIDEALTHLDPHLRAQARAEIVRAHRATGVTTIVVTDDPREAMGMADRMGVMVRGQLAQVGSPAEVYREPATVFVASFFGSPSMNLAMARLEGRVGGLTLRLGDAEVLLAERGVGDWTALGEWVGRAVVVGLRPERVHRVGEAPDELGLGRVVGVVEAVEPQDGRMLVHVTIDAPGVEPEPRPLAAPDSPQVTESGASARWVLWMESTARVALAEQVDLVVDTTEVHLFDPATGRTLRR